MAADDDHQLVGKKIEWPPVQWGKAGDRMYALTDLAPRSHTHMRKSRRSMSAEDRDRELVQNMMDGILNVQPGLCL
jgi:hypothetical protein